MLRSAGIWIVGVPSWTVVDLHLELKVLVHGIVPWGCQIYTGLWSQLGRFTPDW